MDLSFLKNLEFFHYLVLGGAGVIILALILYFTPLSRLRLPAILIGTIGGLATGLALGVTLMALRDEDQTKEKADKGAEASAGEKSGKQRARSGGPQGGMGMPGGGRQQRDGNGPTAKAQLAALIAKLDLLTHKSLQVSLNAQQKQKIQAQIEKLDARDNLSEDEARQTLEGLLAVLEKQRETLEEAGYRWPGQQGGGNQNRGTPPPNPFKQGADNEHLKSLLSRLEDKPTE